MLMPSGGRWDSDVSLSASLDEQEQALTIQAQSIDQLAHGVIVANENDYRQAAVLITETINGVLKEVDATFDDLIADAYRNHRNLIARKSQKAKPFEDAKSHIESIMLKWRKDEQAKAFEKARLDRLEAERIARDSQIKRLQEQRAEEIGRLMSQGHVTQAQEAMDKVMNGDLGPLPKLDIVPIPSTFHPTIPKVAGVSTRTYWHWRISNRQEIKPDYLTPDDKLIKAIVDKKHKEAEGIVGGIEVWSDEGMATKGRK
jgi:hypothetical protein